jgi:predicted nuclease of predicted toxin-antitoxin system
MALPVKLDEDLSASLAAIVRQYGLDAATVRGQGLGGLEDPDLWPHILAEGRFFVTSDKGFGDIRKFPPGSHAGILVLRPDREKLSEHARLLDFVLRNYGFDCLKGAVAVVTPRGLRVRYPP